MDLMNMMSALDFATVADTMPLSLLSTGVLLDVVWTFLLGSLVMGLMAALATVIQRQRSHWLHNRLEQSPRQIDAGITILIAPGTVERPAASALGNAA
jgi:hypothetical protein